MLSTWLDHQVKTLSLDVLAVIRTNQSRKVRVRGREAMPLKADDIGEPGIWTRLSSWPIVLGAAPREESNTGSHRGALIRARTVDIEAGARHSPASSFCGRCGCIRDLHLISTRAQGDESQLPSSRKGSPALSSAAKDSKSPRKLRSNLRAEAPVLRSSKGSKGEEEWGVAAFHDSTQPLSAGGWLKTALSGPLQEASATLLLGHGGTSAAPTELRW